MSSRQWWCRFTTVAVHSNSPTLNPHLLVNSFFLANLGHLCGPSETPSETASDCDTLHNAFHNETPRTSERHIRDIFEFKRTTQSPRKCVYIAQWLRCQTEHTEWDSIYRSSHYSTAPTTETQHNEKPKWRRPPARLAVSVTFLFSEQNSEHRPQRSKTTRYTNDKHPQDSLSRSPQCSVNRTVNTDHRDPGQRDTQMTNTCKIRLLCRLAVQHQWQKFKKSATSLSITTPLCP